MKKITLLHVTSSLKIGGAESLLCDIIRNLGHDEFEHLVVYFHSGPHVESISKMGVPVYQVNGLLCLYDPLFFIRLFLLIKKISPDLIHSLLWSANVSSRVVAKFLHIPHVSAYHLDIYNDGILRNSIDRVTRKCSDCVVAVAGDVANSLGSEKTYKKLQVIRNGIDFKHMHADKVGKCVQREALGLKKEDFVIGAVGRFHPQKNFSLLMQSFALFAAKAPGARLVLVGLGEQEQYLRDLADQLGISDSVLFVVGKKALYYYPLFDCFVQSSLKEGLSVALLEAMSFGLPCIVTDNTGIHPVLRHNINGVLVKFSDQTSKNTQMSLYEAILQVFEDATFADNLGKNAKKSVLEGFSVDAMVAQYKILFRSLSNRKLSQRF